MQIDLDQLIGSLSDTVDLVGVDEIQHGKRVAYMALACAETQGLSTAEAARIYRIGLLHDCGVSSTRVHKKLVDSLDWKDSAIHCRIGAERMRQFPPLSSLAEAILHHHTRWDQLRTLPVAEEIRKESALVYLLDRVDALSAMLPGPNRLAGKEEICRRVYELRHIYFDPESVEIFLETAASEAFWISMEPANLPEALKSRQPASDRVTIGFDELASAAALFAQIVDAKSHYTAEHSCGVATLSRFLAKGLGLADAICGKVEIAGLLHDLGKLQVPDAILESKGGLSGKELSTIRHHSYVTYRILNKIDCIDDIALWAAYHHEKLDGSGYPFRKKAEDLSIEARVIIAADIFQALAQNRPYRTSQSLNTIMDFLNDGKRQGQLDADVVRLIETESAACYAIATAAG